MMDCGVGDHDVLLLEQYLLADLGDYVVVGDDRLLLGVVALGLDTIHTIAENRIYLALIVVTEDEQALAQVEVDVREVFVVELVVLRRVRQMGQDACNLLALGCVTNLVQLIKVDDWVHALAIQNNLHNLAPDTSLIGIGVTLQETGVRGAAESDEREGSVQDLADTLPDQAGFTCAHRTLDGDSCADGLGVRDQLTQHLHNLHLGVV